ncbi:hypothetical protein [uncultured Duncaniella sp.]|uniref:hypothetical protein n=1 Tax=uncultured Duncaniella sp. TaxID=2768039 RepID=UPI00261BC969|nr:hypothetical protein [uncultured Duncaniella sp.]
MTQLVLNISDPSVLPTLKKVVKAFNGVTIAPKKEKKAKCGLDEALEDVREGRVSGPFNSFDEMLAHALK